MRGGGNGGLVQSDSAGSRWKAKGSEYLAGMAAEPGLVLDELQIRGRVDVGAQATGGDDPHVQLCKPRALAMRTKAVISERRRDRRWRRELERVRTAAMTIGRDDDGAFLREEQLEIGRAKERQVRCEQERT